MKTKTSFIHRRAFLASAAGLGLAGLLPAAGSAQQASVLRPRIEAALNAIRTQKARFAQIDTSSGYGLEGDVYLSRPGRLRFEYDNGDQLLIADGTHVARINTRTNTVSRTRLAATPLRVILADEIDLTDGITITSTEQTPDALFVTFYENGKRDKGLLTIFLDVDSFELRGWKIDESDGNITTVILRDVEQGVDIDPSLYEIPGS